MFKSKLIPSQKCTSLQSPLKTATIDQCIDAQTRTTDTRVSPERSQKNSKQELEKAEEKAQNQLLKRENQLKCLLLASVLKLYVDRKSVDPSTSRPANVRLVASQANFHKKLRPQQRLNRLQTHINSQQKRLRTKDNKLFYMTIDPSQHLDSVMLQVHKTLIACLRQVAVPVPFDQNRTKQNQNTQQNYSVQRKVPPPLTQRMNNNTFFKNRLSSALGDILPKAKKIEEGVERPAADSPNHSYQRSKRSRRSTIIIGRVSGHSPHNVRHSSRRQSNLFSPLHKDSTQYNFGGHADHRRIHTQQNQFNYLKIDEQQAFPVGERLSKQSPFIEKKHRSKQQYNRSINYSHIKPNLTLLQECQTSSKPGYLSERCARTIVQTSLVSALKEFFEALQRLKESTSRFQRINAQKVGIDLRYVNLLFQETNKLIYQMKLVFLKRLKKAAEMMSTVRTKGGGGHRSHRVPQSLKRSMLKTEYKQSQEDEDESQQDCNYTFRATSEAEAFRFNRRQLISLQTDTYNAMSECRSMLKGLSFQETVNECEGYIMIQQAMKTRFNVNQIVEQLKYMQEVHPRKDQLKRSKENRAGANLLASKRGLPANQSLFNTEVDRNGRKLCLLESIRALLKNRQISQKMRNPAPATEIVVGSPKRLMKRGALRDKLL